ESPPPGHHAGDTDQHDRLAVPRRARHRSHRGPAASAHCRPPGAGLGKRAASAVEARLGTRDIRSV
ncbi:MAG: hypothetical protein AVDCRST_MAG31-2273, partial [uncultured Sphingomonas sp.]